MEIPDWQQFARKFINPLGSTQALTFGTVSIAARIIGNTHMSTLVASFGMAPHCTCSAMLNGKHCFSMM
jgi:hypothetical protein